MTSYQDEQLETLGMVRRYFKNLSPVEWNELQERRKRFTWPDKPILFDDLEKRFIDAGLKSTLMYLHNSPGLLRIKNQWQ